MKEILSRKKLAGLVVAAAILSFSLFFWRASINPKCPEDFPNDDAGFALQMEAFEKWSNDFYDSHPGAMLSDWNKARVQFYIDNECTEAMQRYNDAKAGKEDPERYQIVRDTIDEVIKDRQ